MKWRAQSTITPRYRKRGASAIASGVLCTAERRARAVVVPTGRAARAELHEPRERLERERAEDGRRGDADASPAAGRRRR